MLRPSGLDYSNQQYASERARPRYVALTQSAGGREVCLLLGVVELLLSHDGGGVVGVRAGGFLFFADVLRAERVCGRWLYHCRKLGGGLWCYLSLAVGGDIHSDLRRRSRYSLAFRSDPPVGNAAGFHNYRR
jgi:hypothetical protein